MSKKGDNRQARPVVTDISAVKISGSYWVTRSYAEIADLISEGPIEGIVSGDYSYLATENQTGYDNVTFSEYNATGAAGGEALSELGFLRSIYWNEVPIVDKHGYFNFQDINVEHNFGNPIGDLPSLSANLGDGEDFDLSVERGIGERLFGPQVKGFEKGSEGSAGKDYSPGRQGAKNARKATLEGAIDRYSKTYTIYNKECSSLQVNIKVDALFEQILAGKKLYEDKSELLPCHEADVGYGDTKARTIKYNVYYMALFDDRFNPAREDASQEDGAFTDQWNLANNKTDIIHGKVDFPYIRTTHITIPTSYKDTPGFQGWKIRIVRLTPESLSSYLTNRSFVHSIVEVYGTRLRYPYTSMVYSRFDARNFKSIPHRSYDTRLLKVKVPSNYNPICKTYGDSDAANDDTGQRTGARYFPGTSTWTAQRGLDAPKIFWDGEFKKDANGEYIREWTDNAAWCFYDLVTNSRYGLGDYIKETDVDKWSLYEIAQYCDGMVPDGFGSYEPRFSMNYIITSREEAFKVLNDLSSMFRGITYYAHGSIFAVQDKYRDPVFQFNNSNVTQGDFTYSSSSKKARHSVAIIRYNDKREFFRPAVEYMEDEESVRKYGILELETTALGCTSKGQARRFGKWILASESEETETVQFSIGHEGGLIRPGDVIQIYDNFRSPLKRSGRTNAVIPTSSTVYYIDGAGYNITGNSVILDSALEFTAGKDYNFSLLTPTFSYNTTQITGLNSSGINEINRSQIQNLVFSGQHARVITGSYKSEYYEGGSGICTEIYFHTGEDLGGLSNQLDFDNYVITGYTNTGVNTELGATVADYSGGCFSGENLIWSVEPSSSEDPEFLSGNFSNFRIINIKEEDNNNYSVAALAYSTGKYDSVDSSVKLRDLSYYDTPQFPTGENDSASAAELTTNTSLSLHEDTPYQQNIENTEYKSIKIDFDKAGYNRIENENGSKVDISDELTYFVSITTTGNPNQHHTPTKDNLYTIPTSDYKNIYKTNTNLIITPEDTLYTDVVTEGKILAEVLITEKENYYVTVFAANGAGRLSKGIQRVFDVADIGNLTFFSAVNHITVSNLVTQGIIDSSFPSEDYLLSGAKVQEGLAAGEPGFIWTVGFENALLNAPVDNNEGPDGPDGEPGDIPTYPLQMFENAVDWRITVRAPSRKLEKQPSSPNIPSDVIYLEFTGYQTDPSFPSFVFTIDYNNPALIRDLRSRDLTIVGSDITGYKANGLGITTDNTVDAQGNREVAYYLVDPSGMIVKNDFNAFPLREFDMVVEPHDKDGRTSQGHYVWSNTIYDSTNKDDPVNLQRGTEQYKASSVNNKYDIFGSIIAPPSGVIFVPTKKSTTINTLMGGENDSFILPEDAYARNIPYVASALLLPDGSFTIGVEPSENLQGDQLYTEEQLGELFGGARGMVFYYTVGTGARSARDFTIAPEKIPTYTAKSTSQESAGGQAFGGIVTNIENGTIVYRGFYVFGENDSPARLSLKIPQIKGPNENINICAALFDTLSLAKSFTPETRRPLFYENDALEGTPLILLDRDMNFNVRASASTGAKYKLNELGQLDLTPQDGVRFGELNRPIKITEFSMISPTQQGLSNQSWGQIYLSLLGFATLKNVVGYEVAEDNAGEDNAGRKKGAFYRWNTAGGEEGNSAVINYPLQAQIEMYKGGCYTLPMMLANAYCREFLQDPHHFYSKRNMSETPWFIMGYGDPEQYGTSDSLSLKEGYLSTTYTSDEGGPRLNPLLTESQRKVVDADGLDKMKALLGSITEHDTVWASQSIAANQLAVVNPIAGNKIRYSFADAYGTIMEQKQSDNVTIPTETILQAEQNYKLFWPFTTALNPVPANWGSSNESKYNVTPYVPVSRTVYEFYYDRGLLESNSIVQRIDKANIVPKLKVIEMKMPDLPYMAIQPGGERSPTGWRVRHFAYVEVTVYFTNELNATNSYIVNPLEGYMGNSRTTFENDQGLEGVLYNSEELWGMIGHDATDTHSAKMIWESEGGGLVKMPHNFGPRLIRKNPTSFTFVLGAPKSWDPSGGGGLELANWIGTDAMGKGIVDGNLGFNLINFAVLKSTE